MNLPHLVADPAPAPAERRRLLLVTGLGAGMVGAGLAMPLVAGFAPSERARAQGAALEVDIADLAPGAMKTVEWRGKPVWIVRRTAQMMAALRGREAQLADPASARAQQPGYAANPGRSVREDVFVAIGICTHLGCSPTPVPAGAANTSVGPDWPGGFFCPCHGSTFDGAGRVYRNKPAPTNLEIPPHRYVSETRLLIGADGAA